MKNCGYCVNLKVGLTEEKIQFMYKDIAKYPDEFNKIVEKTKKELAPTILVNKQILVPTISFNTIEEAINIIKTLI